MDPALSKTGAPVKSKPGESLCRYLPANVAGMRDVRIVPGDVSATTLEPGLADVAAAPPIAVLISNFEGVDVEPLASGTRVVVVALG